MRGGQMTPEAMSGGPRFSSSSNNNQQYPHPQQQQRCQVEVQTPVVSVYNNSYNLSTIGNNTHTSSSSNASAIMSPAWTADEHHRFLDGLEKYGGNNQDQGAVSAQNVWQSITSAVRTRSLQEVKVHANRYFLELQLVNSRKRKEHLMMQTIDSRWTLEEDAQFEHLLAFHVSRDDLVCYPWEQIAARLPNKSPRDVQERYHKLCYDVARIEAGHHVMMSFGRSSRNTKATISGIGAVHPVSAYSIAATQNQQQPGDIDRSNREQDHADSVLGPIDCVVTLTVDEEAILMKALEQVHVSPNAPPQMLTSIASAVAAIANSRNKKPPQRTQPLFTLEEARTVFDQIINEQYYHRQQQQQQYIDPRAVLEELVHKLRLQLRDQDPDRRSSGRVGFEATARKLKPLATAGLAFTDDDASSTLRVYQSSVHFVDAKTDISRRGAVAEDLLSFRAASSHRGSGGGGYSPYPSTPSRHTLFSPSNSSYSSSLLPPSPYPHYVPYTPREASTTTNNDGRDGAAGGERKREGPPSSSSFRGGALEDY